VAGELAQLGILIAPAMKLAQHGTTVFRANGLCLPPAPQVLRAQAEELLERDNACAEVPTKHISHRDALHDAATAH